MDELNKDLKKHSKPTQQRLEVLKQAIYSGVVNGRDKAAFANELDSLGRVLNDDQAVGLAAVYEARRSIARLQNERADSLLEVAKPYVIVEGEDRLRAWWYLSKGTLVQTIDNNAMLSYYDSAAAIFKQHNWNNDLSVALSNIAEAYNNTLSNYPKAMEYHLLAIQAAEHSDVAERLGNAWLGAATTYTYIADYDNALESFEKALRILRDVDSTRYEALIQNNIGELYRLMERFPEARDAYLLSNKYGPQLDNVAVNESNLADVYLKWDSLGQAFHYAFSAREKFTQLGMSFVYRWVDVILSRA